MAIKLMWKPGNAATTQILIYRSLGPTIDPQNLGTPIATVSGDISEYVDNTAVLGNQYTYIIEAKTAYNSVMTKPASQLNLRVRGPGSMAIVRGDPTYGYLGRVDTAEVPDIASHFAAPIPSNNTGAHQTLTIWSSDLIWYKFIRNGKIYLVPSKPITARSGLLFSAMYYMVTEGTASGIDWAFDTSDPKFDAYKKTNIISHNGWNYHLRAPRGFSDRWNGNYDGEDSGLKNTTEFAQLILPMYRGMAFDNQVGNVCPKLLQTWRRRIFTAESLPSTNSIAGFENSTESFDNVLPYTSWNTGGIKKLTVGGEYSIFTGSPALNYSMYPLAPVYWPILELIEE